MPALKSLWVFYRPLLFFVSASAAADSVALAWEGAMGFQPLSLLGKGHGVEKSIANALILLLFIFKTKATSQ